jgi:hypothetical protein
MRGKSVIAHQQLAKERKHRIRVQGLPHTSHSRTGKGKKVDHLQLFGLGLAVIPQPSSPSEWRSLYYLFHDDWALS